MTYKFFHPYFPFTYIKKNSINKNLYANNKSLGSMYIFHLKISI